MNKKYQLVVERYNLYEGRTLYDCYVNPSHAKINAYESIRHEMVDHNGWGLTILSYNSHFFSCAYRVDFIDSDTGEVQRQCLVYHTSRNRLFIEL